MTIFLYSLTFIPMVLTTLAIHELGHMAAARLFRIKISAFQIGIGWKLFTFYTGKTQVRLTSRTIRLYPDDEWVRPGSLVSLHVKEGPDGIYSAVCATPAERRSQLQGEQKEVYQDCNQEFMQLTGRVREVDGEKLVLADIAWSLRAFPVMAGVIVPEDPQREIRNAYNVSPWSRQTIVTLAGPAANLGLMIGLLAILAISPISTVNVPLMTVSEIVPGSPAQRSGLLEGDHILQIGDDLAPGHEEISSAIRRAAQTGKEIHLKITRGRETHDISMAPDPISQTIGVTLPQHISPGREHQMGPGAVWQRFANLAGTYFHSTTLLVQGISKQEKNGPPVVSGPVLGAHQTAQAIDFVGPKAWLAILAVINLTVAIFNLLPIPPMDGFRLWSQTLQKLRHGKPLNPRVEHAITVGGLTIIFITGIYLTLTDILRLLE